jgi:hypothetical protein
MSNIVAVWLKTDSGDSYLFLEKDVIDCQDVVHRIHNGMNDEFAYVYDWEIEVIGDLDRASLSSQIRYFKDDLFEKLDADAD